MNKQNYLHSGYLFHESNYVWKGVSDKCNYGSKGPRIVCLVLTYKKNLETKAKAVAETWGSRCDKLYFVLGQQDADEMPYLSNNSQFIHLDISDKYNQLPSKMLKLFEYVYDNLLNEFDWLFKADDDTYAIVENLKYLLANKCQDDKHSYGKM
jgi:hypothetical protein